MGPSSLYLCIQAALCCSHSQRQKMEQKEITKVSPQTTATAAAVWLVKTVAQTCTLISFVCKNLVGIWFTSSESQCGESPHCVLFSIVLIVKHDTGWPYGYSESNWCGCVSGNVVACSGHMWLISYLLIKCQALFLHIWHRGMFKMWHSSKVATDVFILILFVFYSHFFLSFFCECRCVTGIHTRGKIIFFPLPNCLWPYYMKWWHFFPNWQLDYYHNF